MIPRSRPTSDETRARIISVAEEHFRRVGYARTAVADLAEALGMSSANIYRFFASKNAINDAICRKLLAEGYELAHKIVTSSGSAAQRLEHLISGMHDYNKSRYTSEHRIHDMIEVAMSESWPAVDEHCEAICHLIAQLISDGIAAGEFYSNNVEETARIIFSCCCSLFHPGLIAECAEKDQPVSALQMTRFVLLALTNLIPSLIKTGS